MPTLPVHITGSIRTTKFFNGEIEIESDLKSILESNDLVEIAEVSVTGIKTLQSNYRRRHFRESGEYITKIVDFMAACFVRNQQQLDLEAIRRVLIEAIENSGSFSSTNSTFVVAEPKVIEIKPLFIVNKTEIENKIGECTT